MEKKRKKQQEKSYPAALTVAISDSTGSGGVQADLRTFNAFGVYGCSAITAVAGRTPGKVTLFNRLSADTISAQIDTVLSTVNVRFAKNGVLSNAGIIEALAEAVKKHQLKLICDPAFIMPLDRNLPEAAVVELFKTKLMKLAAWLTPNIPEAELLLGEKITTFAEQVNAAKKLHHLSGASILLKGGHAEKDPAQILPKVTDIVCTDGRVCKVSSLKVDLPQTVTYGVGDTLSAALTATLALELPWDEAICESKAFVMGSLVENVRIGNTLSAMYPPANDYMSSISIEEMDV